jgi:hypothetical protein
MEFAEDFGLWLISWSINTRSDETQGFIAEFFRAKH